MSININHPQDDISTDGGNPPALGGQSPLVADNATVSADSSGNVSRWVMSTGTATATYYAKLATLAFPATNNVAANISLILTPKSASGSYPPVIVTATVLQGTSGLSASSKINVLSSDETAIGNDDLFLITSAATNGTNIELHMQSIIAAAYDVQLLNSSFDTGVSVSAWNDSATWSATDPTIAAAVSVTSDWAGSGQLTSTSFSNGWAGTAYYEKLANGQVIFHIAAGTIGTTTDGTTIFTLPSGYRPGYSHFIHLIGNDTTYAASAGRLVINTDGTVQVFTYTGTNTSARASDVFVARN